LSVKIVLAPDSFKGSLSSPEVCAAMRRGIERVLPDARVESVPLADGGEGTLDALLESSGGMRKGGIVRGPLEGEVEASWGILPDGTAVIECAQSAGLPLVPLARRDALRASTWGMGQQILAALDAGARRFWIGLGGSATTDGATGLLSALGARFFDARDCVLPLGGGDLERLARIETRFLDSRLERCEFVGLGDVSNPLVGENGAARVFAPQKGASPEEVERLERGLTRLADVCAAHFGSDGRFERGAGAAGGLGWGLLTFLRASMRPGIDAVLEAARFDEKLQGADLVLTGEGSLDAQTLNGKTIAGVCRAARTAGVPVVALGGRVALSGAQIEELGLLSALSIVDGPRTLSECLEEGAGLVETATERVLRLWMRF